MAQQAIPWETVAKLYEIVGSAPDMDDKGKFRNTQENYYIVLKADERFKEIRKNELDSALYWGERKYTNADEAYIKRIIERDYGIYSKDKLVDALTEVGGERGYHPIKQIIEKTEWDGTPRIYTILSKWLGCEDTPYTREVSRLIFAGGIARIYNAGCKFDDVAVLIGSQGCGKSTFVRWLAMEDKYFSETTTFEGKEATESIRGKWIVELSELTALKKANLRETIKSFISTQSDHYREAYARTPEDYPRQCIFIGTTNDHDLGDDKTGLRRFYPVEVHSSGYELFDHEEEVRADIAQCWAEARILYLEGKLDTFANRVLLEEIRTRQSEVSSEDFDEASIKAYVDSVTPDHMVCGLEIWDLALHGDSEEGKRPTQWQSKRICEVLRKLGWEKTHSRQTAGRWKGQFLWKKNNS